VRFLKKDVNKSLLEMIAFFLILFVGFTAYYEFKTSSLLKEKLRSEEKLSEITSRLILEKLNNSENLTQIALIDKALLEDRYEELLVEKEELKSEIEQLKAELDIKESELEYQNVKSSGPVAQFRLIQGKNEEIRKLREKIDALCSRLKNSSIYYRECLG